MPMRTRSSFSLRQVGDVLKVTPDWQVDILETSGMDAGRWNNNARFGHDNGGQQYIVIKTEWTGGGTGHGPGDVYPDGHRLTLLPFRHGKIDASGPAIRFYQNGPFTVTIENPECVTSRRDLMAHFNAEVFLEDLERQTDSTQEQAEELRDKKLVEIAQAAIHMGLKQDEMPAFGEVLKHVFAGRPAVGWRRKYAPGRPSPA